MSQPGAQLRELRQRLARVLADAHGQQSVDLRPHPHYRHAPEPVLHVRIITCSGALG
jgi:hypothetical protein